MTLSEENYLKAIYHLEKHYKEGVPTNAIAEEMETKASSVTDMLKKLSEKNVLTHKKYQGARLTKKGMLHAKSVIRKHRLWESFLVEKLSFKWDEVHDVAEQLEHIKSEKLISELDRFLGYPKTDPHGDPIPDEDGNIQVQEKQLLSQLEVGERGICVGVKDSSAAFLQYLDKHGISLGKELVVLHKEEYDESMIVELDGNKITISNQGASNLYLKQK